MYVQAIALKALSTVQLTSDESTILAWMRSSTWEAVAGARDPIPFKTKVPEFYKGVQLYRLQTGGPSAGAIGPLELFLKKLALQGVITKQDLYPLTGHSNQPRYLSLKKVDLDNLGVGKHEEED